MPKTVVSQWQPEKLTQSTIFTPLMPLASQFLDLPQWPSLEQLNRGLFEQSKPIMSRSGARIKLVPQDPKPMRLEEQYAPRIFLSGELQTRLQNWHDFFQAITWAMFPHTKVAINALHYPAAKARLNNGQSTGKRTPLENALSQFDECGVIILSTDESLLQAIRDFNWHSFFWRHRGELDHKIRCITYGHAIYEKAIKPYVGLTAKAILCRVDSLPTSNDELLSMSDALTEQHIVQHKGLTSPQDLHPFPILGMPGYFPGNASEAFYQNTRYFRPKPPVHAATSTRSMNRSVAQ